VNHGISRLHHCLAHRLPLQQISVLSVRVTYMYRLHIVTDSCMLYGSSPPGVVQCPVYYNSHYVSAGDVIEISVLSARDRGHVVLIEPRSLAVPYGHVARLRCISIDHRDDDVISWAWLVNGHPADNSSGQLSTYTETPNRCLRCFDTSLSIHCVVSLPPSSKRLNHFVWPAAVVNVHGGWPV